MWIVSVLRVEKFWGQLRCGFFLPPKARKEPKGHFRGRYWFFGVLGVAKAAFFLAQREKYEDTEGTKLGVDGVLRTGGSFAAVFEPSKISKGILGWVESGDWGCVAQEGDHVGSPVREVSASRGRGRIRGCVGRRRRWRPRRFCRSIPVWRGLIAGSGRR